MAHTISKPRTLLFIITFLAVLTIVIGLHQYRFPMETYGIPVFGTYLAQYSHFNTSLMIQNLIVMCICMAIILIATRHDPRTPVYLILFFIGYPLFVALMWSPTPPGTTRGLSGILYCMYGFLVWMAIRKVSASSIHDIHKILIALSILILSIVPLTGDPIILLDGGGYLSVDRWGHFMGYLFGFSILPLWDILSKTFITYHEPSHPYEE